MGSLTSTANHVTLHLSRFPCGSAILVEWELGDVGFCGGRKTEEPGEKPTKQGEKQQQTRSQSLGACNSHTLLFEFFGTAIKFIIIIIIIIIIVIIIIIIIIIIL